MSLHSCCTPSRPQDGATNLEVRVENGSSAPSFRGMVSLSGGRFLMGSEGPESWKADGEGPVREVEIAPFWMGECAVTVGEFTCFVEATNYVTDAEKFGWSYVFHKHVSGANKSKVRGFSGDANWWIAVESASWRKPEGPGSDVKKRQNHPVVHVSYRDALAFCHWAGKSLPTEAQWEYAARGGLTGQLYPWGNDLTPKNAKAKIEHKCNIWQGKFPDLDTGADGFQNTAPAKTYAPNAFGLYQMSGNVWEWCADWFDLGQERRVVKGGSFLCHASYCNRYRCAARTGNTPDSTTSHTGFRAVFNA
ncbi:MAG TPA: formylglycine-generating enzyme family protein [Abditibacterium sp.]|jgi:formylglycine-generating enzyme required for sulfatase activity